MLKKQNFLSKSSLKLLGENKIFMQTAHVENNRYEITYAQSKYLNNAQAVGRITRVLDQISPNVIEEFSLVAVNADQSMFAVDIPRAEYSIFKKQRKTDALLEAVTIYKPDPKQHLDHDFRPPTKLPTTIWKISPAIRVKSEDLMDFILATYR